MAELFKVVLNLMSVVAIPLMILLFLAWGMAKKVKVYEVFIEGAKDGFNVAVRIIPYLVAMLVAIGIFRASGAMQVMSMLLSPLTNLIGMPAEALPMASAELMLKPLWQERCIGKLGAINMNLPAIRVALYEQFMVIGFIRPSIILYKNIETVAVKRSTSFLGASGVSLKLRGMRSGYFFNSHDPNALTKLIEARL